MKKHLMIGCIAALIAAGCKKDSAIPVSKATSTDSLSPYIGTYNGIEYWSVIGGSSGSNTVSLVTSASSDRSMLIVDPILLHFDASAIIRHHEAGLSGPSSDLKFSNDSLFLFVMQGPRFYHYYCKKQ